MGGRIVQLVQGEKLKLAFDDFEYWIERFAKYPLVQLIDLDAAMRQGENRKLIEMICGRLPCQVGGGLKTAEDGRALLEVGAKRVIYGSSLFGVGEPSPPRNAVMAQGDQAGVCRGVEARAGRGCAVLLRRHQGRAGRGEGVEGLGRPDAGGGGDVAGGLAARRSSTRMWIPRGRCRAFRWRLRRCCGLARRSS
jgi:imidazole glycerol phosphate synthase subunit HisF